MREAQYADDTAIFSDSPIGLQTLLTAYNNMAKQLHTVVCEICIRLSRSHTLSKTESLYSMPNSAPYILLRNMDIISSKYQSATHCPTTSLAKYPTNKME